ncbi:hypothetical protein H6P81_016361 [Aristolochia fimbriata]|uniref:Bifunctional inhibitor/plant lipid transfer protein/seed storage helical domain-containing protein n=1 Tax=Aristolochia fimbriata TaxID=158543 RepID=A0AAV7EB61_ARIFI|nr:hypothetical protein H6P81_016361 [Aristolochia fimbriata]
METHSVLFAATFVFFFSFVEVGCSRFLETGTPCVQQILPCQPFLAAPAPDPVCCTPLKEAFTSQKECLCSLFTNPELLMTFNVTQEEALKLPAACGIKVDFTACKPAGPAEAAGPTTVSPSNPNPAEGSTNNSSSETSPKSGSARGILMAQSEGLLIACFSTFILASYIF